MFDAVLREVQQAAHVLDDQLLSLLVAANEVRSSAHAQRQSQRRRGAINGLRQDDEVVDRYPRGLLERDADDLSVAAQLGGRFSCQEQREVTGRDAPLQGDAAT